MDPPVRPTSMAALKPQPQQLAAESGAEAVAADDSCRGGGKGVELGTGCCGGAGASCGDGGGCRGSSPLPPPAAASPGGGQQGGQGSSGGWGDRKVHPMFRLVRERRAERLMCVDQKAEEGAGAGAGPAVGAGTSNEAQKYGMPTVQQHDMPMAQQYGMPRVQQYNMPMVQQYDMPTVQQYDMSTVQQYNMPPRQPAMPSTQPLVPGLVMGQGADFSGLPGGGGHGGAYQGMYLPGAFMHHPDSGSGHWSAAGGDQHGPGYPGAQHGPGQAGAQHGPDHAGAHQGLGYPGAHQSLGHPGAQHGRDHAGAQPGPGYAGGVPFLHEEQSPAGGGGYPGTGMTLPGGFLHQAPHPGAGVAYPQASQQPAAEGAYPGGGFLLQAPEPGPRSGAAVAAHASTWAGGQQLQHQPYPPAVDLAGCSRAGAVAAHGSSSWAAHAGIQPQPQRSSAAEAAPAPAATAAAPWASPTLGPPHQDLDLDLGGPPGSGSKSGPAEQHLASLGVHLGLLASRWGAGSARGGPGGPGVLSAGLLGDLERYRELIQSSCPDKVAEVWRCQQQQQHSGGEVGGWHVHVGEWVGGMCMWACGWVVCACQGVHVGGWHVHVRGCMCLVGRHVLWKGGQAGCYV